MPLCEEGCVEGLCSDSYPSYPWPPIAGPHFPVMRELESSDCVATATDELGRTTDYLCFGVAETHVSYWADTELPQTISQVDRIRDGTVLQEQRFEMEWDDAANLVLERARTWLDGEWDGAEVSFETVFAADGSIAEAHERTQYPEPNGPEESGNHPQVWFTDDGVERAHRVEQWNAAGQMTRSTLLAGLTELGVVDVVYQWSDEHLLGLTYTRRVQEGEEQYGCTTPDPDHVVCTAELVWDDAGNLVSYVEAGQESVVSDHCCGTCRWE
ncbi:MAG: hypothetical protein IT371_30215 [Deltaproteobacteria bacterium]|nr:hypothetical protein [Deltaproteobacteria bacterium]